MDCLERLEHPGWGWKSCDLSDSNAQCNSGLMLLAIFLLVIPLAWLKDANTAFIQHLSCLKSMQWIDTGKQHMDSFWPYDRCEVTSFARQFIAITFYQCKTQQRDQNAWTKYLMLAPLKEKPQIYYKKTQKEITCQIHNGGVWMELEIRGLWKLQLLFSVLMLELPFSLLALSPVSEMLQWEGRLNSSHLLWLELWIDHRSWFCHDHPVLLQWS